jgi:serine/threonine-protein kinase
VVRARDSVVPRVVALKTLRPGTERDAGVRARFETEARITAQLEHPNIVPVYDLGTLPDGRPYYTMRVVKQQSLRDVLDAPRLFEAWTLSRLVSALAQICGALFYAHQRGVLHRDIKPDNVLLGDFGEVYLADWGVAKVIGTSSSVSELRPARVVASSTRGLRRGISGLIGTPGYIAPEQIRGDQRAIDHRADLFALGVVLYEVLAREHPFEGDTADEVLLATLKCDPPAPRSRVPECPVALEQLCMAMLDRDPAQRPPSAERVSDELAVFLDGARELAVRSEQMQRLNGTRSSSTPRGRP